MLGKGALRYVLKTYSGFESSHVRGLGAVYTQRISKYDTVTWGMASSDAHPYCTGVTPLEERVLLIYDC